MASADHEHTANTISSNVREGVREWASFFYDDSDCSLLFGWIICYVVNAALSLALALPIWLLSGQETYGTAFGLSLDLLFTAQFSACMALNVSRSMRGRVNGTGVPAEWVVGALVVALLAGVAVWNFSSVYLGTGLPPVTLRGDVLDPSDLLFFAVCAVVWLAMPFAVVGGIWELARVAGWGVTLLGLTLLAAVIVTLIVVPSDTLVIVFGWMFVVVVFPALLLSGVVLMVWELVVFVMKFSHQEQP